MTIPQLRISIYSGDVKVYLFIIGLTFYRSPKLVYKGVVSVFLTVLHILLYELIIHSLSLFSFDVPLYHTDNVFLYLFSNVYVSYTPLTLRTCKKHLHIFVKPSSVSSISFVLLSRSLLIFISIIYIKSLG